MTYTIKDLDEAIRELQGKKVALEAGEELCDHHWNQSDGCFECYCTGCDKHITEVHDAFDVPFKKDAYCSECEKTPEQKQNEASERAQSIKNSELSKLAMLREKYPDV
jgi:hypothetical protein